MFFVEKCEFRGLPRKLYPLKIKTSRHLLFFAFYLEIQVSPSFLVYATNSLCSIFCSGVPAEISAHSNAVFDISWIPGGRQVVSSTVSCIINNVNKMGVITI